MGKEAEDEQKLKQADPSAEGASSDSPARLLSRVAPLAALAGAMFLWSGSFVAMKVALSAFHPVYIIFVRMLLGGVLLLPFLLRWSRQSRYAKGEWQIIALMVLSEPCLYFLFEGYALRYTSVSQASMVFALMPLTVAAFAWLFFRERLSVVAWGGFLLAFGGVIWLTLGGESSEHAPQPLLGNTLEFCAVLLATVYTLCARRLRGYPPFFLVAMQTGAGALFFGLLVLFMKDTIPDAYPFLPTLCLFMLGIITCAAYGLYNLGVARLSASRAAAWINVIPGLTLLMGFVFLGETLTRTQFWSLLPIFGGLALSQMVRRGKPEGRR